MLARALRAGAARRRARLRLDQLHRAPLPRRGLRALEQPGAARPVRRHADQAHPRRPARHRAARAQPDPRRRGHRDARPHDGRARERRLRARLPAPLGRRDGAADPRHPRRAAAPARRDRRGEPRSRSRSASRSSSAPGPRTCSSYEGKFWRDPAGRDAVDARGDARSGAAAIATASCARSSVVPKPRAEAAPADLPAVRVVGAQHPLVRGAGRHGDPAAAASAARARAVRALRRGLEARRSATASACCATWSSPTRDEEAQTLWRDSSSASPAPPGSSRSASRRASPHPTTGERARLLADGPRAGRHASTP